MKIVNYSVIDKNIKKIKETNDMILVIKNDAYGFGLIKIFEIGLKNNIKRYAVNDINEAIILRKLNSDIDILLFGYQNNNVELIKEYNITPTVNDFIDLKIYTKNKVYCSLEIDCGMNRFGMKNLDEDVLKNPYIKEIYTHLYQDNKDNSKIIDYIYNLAQKYDKNFHIGGSLAYKYTNYPIRIGMMIYNNCDSLIGNIIYIKKIKKGETVGYNGLYTAKKDEMIGICDIGYINGIKQNYNGRVSINDKYYKIIGKVCMNQSFILIDNSVKIGDIVTFFGKKISKNEFLTQNNMSNYESFLLIR